MPDSKGKPVTLDYKKLCPDCKKNDTCAGTYFRPCSDKLNNKK